jgi:hypothetical protein
VGLLTARVALAICLVLILATAAGCDPGATITYVNETDKTLVVYTAEDLEPEEYDALLQPHSTVRAGTIKMSFKDVVIVRDQNGNILFREEITWDELKAQGFRFVITEDMLSPTPAQGQ